MSEPPQASPPRDLSSSKPLKNIDSGPSLNGDRSFWSLTVTQFFGAFNDNLFKQVMLLLAVPVVASLSEHDEQGDAQLVFSLPFILFSGYAGHLADKYSKTRIIIAAKFAEIAVMILGLLAFMQFGIFGYKGLLVVLFLMGIQSAFFGPSKYGVLPEMLPDSDLPRANGIILMTTFAAIILGTASAGLLSDKFLDRNNPSQLWIACAICVGIAVVGMISSLMIRPIPAAQPKLKFQLSSLLVPPDTRRMLLNDRPLIMALGASSAFWLVAGMAMLTVNSLGLIQLKLTDLKTSILVAVIAVGIGAGALIAGRLSHGKVNFRLVRIGSFGIVVCLSILSIAKPGGQHLLEFEGSLVMLIGLGIFAGLFSIPVQVFLQSRPPAGQKGRMIAVMNQANFVALALSGWLYTRFDRIVDSNQWPRSAIFAMMAACMLPVALFYHPNEEGEPRQGIAQE